MKLRMQTKKSNATNMKLWTGSVIVALSLLLTVCGGTSTGQPTAQVKSTLNKYFKALNKSDTQTITGLYTKDGVFMPPGLPAFVGLKNVTKAYQGVFKKIELDVKLTIDEVIVAGSWAFARTSSVGKVTIKAINEKKPEGNKELFILKSVAGDWKIARYSFNPMPLPGQN